MLSDIPKDQNELGVMSECFDSLMFVSLLDTKTDNVGQLKQKIYISSRNGYILFTVTWLEKEIPVGKACIINYFYVEYKCQYIAPFCYRADNYS